MRLIYLLPSQDARPVADASADGSFQTVDGTGLGKAKEKWRIGGISQIAHLGQSRDECCGHPRAHHVATGQKEDAAGRFPEHRLLVGVPAYRTVLGQNHPVASAGFGQPFQIRGVLIDSSSCATTRAPALRRASTTSLPPRLRSTKKTSSSAAALRGTQRLAAQDVFDHGHAQPIIVGQ